MNVSTPQNIINVIEGIFAAFGIAATLMANLPQGAPGTWWNTIRTVVNWIGQNYGHAKNVHEKGQP